MRCHGIGANLPQQLAPRRRREEPSEEHKLRAERRDADEFIRFSFCARTDRQTDGVLQSLRLLIAPCVTADTVPNRTASNFRNR